MDAELLATIGACIGATATMAALHLVERLRARPTRRIELPPRAGHEPRTHVHQRPVPHDWARTYGWPNQ